MVKYDFDIEKSKDGFNILKIHKDNKKIYVGSKYKMKDTIDQSIKNISKDTREDSIFLIFGFGSGECLNELNKLYPKNKIIIFEPNDTLVDYVKSNIKNYVFLSRKDVYFINTKKADLMTALSNVIEEYEITKVVYRCILNYDKIYNDEFYGFTKVVKEFLMDKSISRNTNMLFYEAWFKTLINNLKYIITSTCVDVYKNKYKNVPAIIVSAGPSLSKNINQLKKINKNMIILSGGRTLKPLLDRGINPNLLGIVDPGEVSYKLVEEYIDKCNVPLLFYEGTNSNVVKYHKESKIVYSQSKMIDNILNVESKNLTGGGSIAHTLTMNAIFFGCNPIIFIGQDLAYTDERFHADIAKNYFCNDDDNLVTNEGEIYIEDINGSKVKTSGVLDNFRRDFETIIKINKDINFIDATEGGAKIRGTIIMTLEEAIENYKLNEPLDFFKERDITDKEKIKMNTIGMLEDSIKACDFIKYKCKEGLKVLDDLRKNIIINDNCRVNKNLKKLDKIDVDIKEKYKKLEILNNLLYPITYSILSSYMAKNNEEIINKNKFLYESILEKVEYALGPITNALLEIRNLII